MKQIINDYDLVQHIQGSTHNRDGLLDLVFTSPLNPEVTSTHVEASGISDHSLVVSGRSQATSKMRDFRDAENQVDRLKQVPVVAHRV